MNKDERIYWMLKGYALAMGERTYRIQRRITPEEIAEMRRLRRECCLYYNEIAWRVGVTENTARKYAGDGEKH